MRDHKDLDENEDDERPPRPANTKRCKTDSHPATIEPPTEADDIDMRIVLKLVSKTNETFRVPLKGRPDAKDLFSKAPMSLCCHVSYLPRPRSLKSNACLRMVK